MHKRWHFMTTIKSAAHLRTPDFPGEFSRISSALMLLLFTSCFIYKHNQPSQLTERDGPTPQFTPLSVDVQRLARNTLKTISFRRILTTPSCI